MKIEEIVKHLIEAIRNNQELNGEIPPGIKVTTCPMTDLSQFDSLNALEVLTDLEMAFEEKLNKEITLDPILFFKGSGVTKMSKESVYNYLTVEEIAKNILNYISARS